MRCDVTRAQRGRVEFAISRDQRILRRWWSRPLRADDFSARMAVRCDVGVVCHAGNGIEEKPFLVIGYVAPRRPRLPCGNRFSLHGSPVTTLWVLEAYEEGTGLCFTFFFFSLRTENKTAIDLCVIAVTGGLRRARASSAGHVGVE